jgi:hypothetical protein
MWNPKAASDIVSRIKGVTPLFASRGDRKGAHVKYAFRYQIQGPLERHLSISARGTKKGITVYVNALSVQGTRFALENLPGVDVSNFYPKGHRGKNGDKGLSAAAGSLSTLLPREHDVYRFSVTSELAFRQLLNWYSGYGATGECTKSDAVDNAVEAAEKAGNIEEATALRTIKTRRGQPEFRSTLIRAYDGRCCVTGCGVIDVLEAAHIMAHAVETDYSTSNGLLLRADIHTLFDLHLIAFGDDGQVHIANSLVGSDYERLRGKQLRLPVGSEDRPNPVKLRSRFENFFADR